jgi:succinate-acetate transporter protein
MAVVEETTRPAAPLVVADPAPLGLAAFALTTFMLSGHNASFIPDIAWVGLALFYGGLVQLLAGMWEFRNRNVFGSTAFSSYGAFWIGLGLWYLLVASRARPAVAVGTAFLTRDQAWIFLAFAIFNTYMLILSAQVNKAVFAVFLTLELTEIFGFIGLFSSLGVLQFAGYIGIVTAFTAWYASFAGVANGLGGRVKLPVGTPLV